MNKSTKKNINPKDAPKQQIPHIGRVYPLSLIHSFTISETETIERQPQMIAKLLGIDYVDVNEVPKSAEDVSSKIRYGTETQCRLLELLSIPEEERSEHGKATTEQLKKLVTPIDIEIKYNKVFESQRETLELNYPSSEQEHNGYKTVHLSNPTGTNPQDKNSFYLGYFSCKTPLPNIDNMVNGITFIQGNKTKWLSGISLLTFGHVLSVYQEVSVGIKLPIHTSSINTNVLLSGRSGLTKCSGNVDLPEDTRTFLTIENRVRNTDLDVREDHTLFISGTVCDKGIICGETFYEISPKEIENDMTTYSKEFETDCGNWLTSNKKEKCFIVIKFKKRIDSDKNYPEVKLLFDFVLICSFACHSNDMIDTVSLQTELLSQLFHVK